MSHLVKRPLAREKLRQLCVAAGGPITQHYFESETDYSKGAILARGQTWGDVLTNLGFPPKPRIKKPRRSTPCRRDRGMERLAPEGPPRVCSGTPNAPACRNTTKGKYFFRCDPCRDRQEGQDEEGG